MRGYDRDRLGLSNCYIFPMSLDLKRLKKTTRKQEKRTRVILKITAIMSITWDFKDKTIAITGGAQGIGFATAQLLAAAGTNLSLADV